jgi:Putative heavy-metal-binding
VLPPVEPACLYGLQVVAYHDVGTNRERLPLHLAGTSDSPSAALFLHRAVAQARRRCADSTWSAWASRRPAVISDCVYWLATPNNSLLIRQLVLITIPSEEELMAKVTVSTGDFKEPYDIIDLVFAYGSSGEGFLKTANPLEAYGKVADQLRERAAKIGANGVVHAAFDYRTAVGAGCGSGKQVFEVFAYGTAVRTRQ